MSNSGIMTFSLFTTYTQISDILIKNIGSLSIFQPTFYEMMGDLFLQRLLDLQG